jgi:hypothetical protein
VFEAGKDDPVTGSVECLNVWVCLAIVLGPYASVERERNQEVSPFQGNSQAPQYH